MSDQADPMIGRSLRDKWRIDGVLGSGGMGTVYAATHRNGSRGAVKVLHRHLSANPSLAARFAREGLVANTVGHPGVVRILDDDVDDGLAFVVMELLEGETWKARWLAAARRLGVREVLETGIAVLDVLEAAHDRGVIHRDVKPDNVFLTTSGAVKLLDFGIARLREISVEGTETGAMLGTPAYMSPEQALARWSEVDHTSDLFSLGATLRFLLTGRPLHERTTGPEMLVAAATTPARPFEEVFPRTSPELAAALDRAVAFQRAARWQSAAAMRGALGSALATLTAGVEPPAPPALGAGPSGATASTALAVAVPSTERAPAPSSTPRGAPPPVEAGSTRASSGTPSALREGTDRTVVSASLEPSRAEPRRASIVLPMLGGAALALAAGAIGIVLLRDAPPSDPVGAASSAPSDPSEALAPNTSAPREPTATADATIEPSADAPVVSASAAVTNRRPVQLGPPRPGCACRSGAVEVCADLKITCRCVGTEPIYPTGHPTFPTFYLFRGPLSLYDQGTCSGLTAGGRVASGRYVDCAVAPCSAKYVSHTGAACKGYDASGALRDGVAQCPSGK